MLFVCYTVVVSRRFFSVGYLVMYVATGLQRPGGGTILPNPDWEIHSLVICHSINTSTYFPKKKKKEGMEWINDKGRL